MENKKRISFIKIILLIFVLIAFVGMTVYLFPVMKNLSTHDGQVVFKQKIDDSGVLGFL